jgi:hypothetical protein
VITHTVVAIATAAAAKSAAATAAAGLCGALKQGKQGEHTTAQQG